MLKQIFPDDGEILTDIEKYLFSGPVKAVMEVTYLAHLNAGNVIQGKIMAGGNRDTNFIMCFSPNGVCLTDTTYKAEGSEDGHVYNDLGQMMESYTRYKGGGGYRTLYTYNDAGQMVESRHLDEKGILRHRYEHTFIESGEPHENITYRGENTEWDEKTVYTYDDKAVITVRGKTFRNWRTIVRYKAGGEIEYSSTRTYDERGLEIESTTHYTDPKMASSNIRTVHKYNEHGHCIEMIRYREDGSVDTAHTFTHEYDDEGNKIVEKRERIFDPYPLEEGETEKLEHDHHGNWIKRTVFKKEKPQTISIRQFTYYGEPSENNPPFVHPLTNVEDVEVADVSNQMEPLDPKDARWLAEGSVAPDKFALQRYYIMRNNEHPSVLEYRYDSIEAVALLALLKRKFMMQMVFSTATLYYHERFTSYVLEPRFYPGYMLLVDNISRHDRGDYEETSLIEDLLDNYGESLYFGDVQLLRPSQDSKNYDEYFENDIQHCVEACTLDRVPEKPYIYIVETVTNGFVLKSHPVKDNFEIRDLNVNYGYGFQQFHDELMQRFNTSTKGLVLFHGEPGTGKTYYIRHLLRKMVAHRKKVIYMPPNMVDHLIDPAFMTFLAREVRSWSSQGNFCVLLIEDAEPLLAKRREGVRIQGVTNLLNLSDGLLNDMLNLQIICTFNVDLKKLDSALLRPGRLIARKEFKKLEELDANLLAQRLGIKHHFTAPASLGEIYAMLKNQNTIIHDVMPDRDASVPIDDL